jgi:hypothetical protein
VALAAAAALAVQPALAYHDDHNPSPIPTPVPTHRPTHTWPPTQTFAPTGTPTPVPTLNDPGQIDKIWFTFVDVDRLDVSTCRRRPPFLRRGGGALIVPDARVFAVCVTSKRRAETGGVACVALSGSFLCVYTHQVAWEMPKDYDDEGLRIKKYEVELRLLRTHVATYTSTDVDTLSHSFTVRDAASTALFSLSPARAPPEGCPSRVGRVYVFSFRRRCVLFGRCAMLMARPCASFSHMMCLFDFGWFYMCGCLSKMPGPGVRQGVPGPGPSLEHVRL